MYENYALIHQGLWKQLNIGIYFQKEKKSWNVFAVIHWMAGQAGRVSK